MQKRITHVAMDDSKGERRVVWTGLGADGDPVGAGEKIEEPAASFARYGLRVPIGVRVFVWG